MLRLLSCGRTARRVQPHSLEPAQLSLHDAAAAASSSSEHLIARIAASGGLEPSLRLALWPPLLKLVPWPSSISTDALDGAALDAEYSALRERAPGTVDASLVRTIEADVPRTDSTLSRAQLSALHDLLLAHCVLQPTWGYFQGMNDICRVVLSAHDASAAGGDAPAPRLGTAFFLLRGVLAHSSDNWAHANLDGVWRQARAVRRVLLCADRKLMRHIDAVERAASTGPRQAMAKRGRGGGGGGGGRASDAPAPQQPFACLFGAIFLRLKRELLSVEEAMRLWEVCWASGRHFHVLCLAALVRRLRAELMRVRAEPSGAGELHRLFGTLHGTQSAAALLEGARALQATPGVADALDSVMASVNA